MKWIPGQRHLRQQAEAVLEQEPIRRPCGGYGLGLEEKQSIHPGATARKGIRAEGTACVFQKRPVLLEAGWGREVRERRAGGVGRDTPCWALNAGSGARLHPAGRGSQGGAVSRGAAWAALRGAEGGRLLAEPEGRGSGLGPARAGHGAELRPKPG